MSAPTTMRLKSGVSVPMDTDGIAPHSLTAAFTVAVETLLERTTNDGITLDWATVEFGLQPGTDGATMMIVRAARL